MRPCRRPLTRRGGRDRPWTRDRQTHSWATTQTRGQCRRGRGRRVPHRASAVRATAVRRRREVRRPCRLSGGGSASRVVVRPARRSDGPVARRFGRVKTDGQLGRGLNPRLTSGPNRHNHRTLSLDSIRPRIDCEDSGCLKRERTRAPHHFRKLPCRVTQLPPCNCRRPEKRDPWWHLGSGN